MRGHVLMSGTPDERYERLHAEMSTIRADLHDVRSEVRQIRKEVQELVTADAVMAERVGHLSAKIEEVIGRIERWFPDSPAMVDRASSGGFQGPFYSNNHDSNSIVITPRTVRNVIWLILQIISVLGGIGGLGYGLMHEAQEPPAVHAPAPAPEGDK